MRRRRNRRQVIIREHRCLVFPVNAGSFAGIEIDWARIAADRAALNRSLTLGV